MRDLNTEPTLREKFARWQRDPNSSLQLTPNPAGTVPTLQLIEEALWVAHRAGYGQAMHDSDGLQRLTDFLKERP